MTSILNAREGSREQTVDGRILPHQLARSPRWNLAVQGGLDGIEMFGALGQHLATLAIGGDDFGSNRVRSGLGDGKVPEYFLNPDLPVVLLS